MVCDKAREVASERVISSLPPLELPMPPPPTETNGGAAYGPCHFGKQAAEKT